ncbi:hypothetical protein GCM10027019_18040 [Melaminivora jejuensis]|uniref:Lcl C-terminal domain-containing protein n=1 Tax=Melaminivora jejuensis TaxID=1267217 RepID=UPI001AE00A18|nr:DUF1566 domain-containing protein [Melaminivora jejuensis]UHJ65638.1 DUF1566 domain-containing protein [Melaminivora jejuensis]
MTRTPASLSRSAALAPWLALALCTAPAAQAQTHPLNDTGITWSGDALNGNVSTCDASHPAGQDCHYGRDKAAADGVLAKIGGGNAGFDFSKISNSGHVLDASVALGSGPDDWACTRDNVTGLIWEVKTTSGLRSQSHTYTWYNTDTNTNGGADGAAGNTTTCSNTLGGQNCNTQNYVAAVNAGAGLCGHTDWRMPTIKELEGIADLGRSNPAIDPIYFLNTPSSNVWSGSPDAGNSSYAWFVGFNVGYAGLDYRSNDFHVRLVRAGQ